MDVGCYGRNIDRLLFNPRGGMAHYAFISGKAETDGSFILSAGRAHCIQEGMVYGIYGSQIATDRNKRLGYLSVFSVKDATAVLRGSPLDPHSPSDTPSNPSFYVPSVFYAVETYSSYQTLEIFYDGDVNIAEIKSPSWRKADKQKADITLKLADDKIEFLWNGFVKSSMRVMTGSGNNFSVAKDNQELVKAMMRATRFTYYTGSFPDSLFSPLFRVEFKEFDEDSVKPTGEDLLRAGLVDLQITQQNRNRSFCLVIYNNADVPIWPFVFLCEPKNFSICTSF